MDTDTGALSVEDAVARLSTEEAVEDQTHDQDTPETEDDAPETASEVDDDGEVEAEERDPSEEDPEEPAIAPPNSWDADHKAKWDSLPRDVQEYLASREAERDRGVSAAQQRAAEARQRAELEAQAIAAIKPQIQTLVGQAKAQLDRWSGMDATAWQQLAETDPNRYVQAKAAFDADVQQVQQLDAARQQAEAVEYNAFTQAQTARLPEIAPHLANDPKLQGEVFDYIAKSIPQMSADQKRWISADEFAIAWKAMQYDAAQAPQPKPQGKKVVSARPSTPPAPLRQRRVGEVEARFKKSGSISDAVALLNAKGM